MQVQPITIARAHARDLYRKYKEHAHHGTDIDAECRRAYQLLAQGKLVIKALESIRVAGLNEQKLPKLAICRADRRECYWSAQNSRGVFKSERWISGHHVRRRIEVAWPGMSTSMPSGRCVPPTIPLHLRPRRALASYHILWEAEWTPIPPQDPYLLRRIGKADLWLVVAMWDLTGVERAALSTRMA